MNKKVHIGVGDWGYIVEDLVRSTSYALTQLGYTVTHGRNTLDPEATILNLGLTMPLEELQAVGGRMITYNLEQMRPGNWMAESARATATLKIGYNWDYAKRNAEVLRSNGLPCSFVPIGFVPPMQSIIKPPQDIDVLFYGYSTDRRLECFKEIERLGMKMYNSECLEPWHMPWTNELRNHFISRSKVIVNPHAHLENNVFEMVRCSWLLANAKCVVAEVNKGDYIEQDIQESIVCGSIKDLPELCQLVVEREDLRKIVEDRSLEAFKKRDHVAYVERGMREYEDWFSVVYCRGGY